MPPTTSSTGKLQWELGGQESLGLSDTFFLGPPLPLRGQLYVMAEIKDEMRLLALDGATGNLLWSQQLAMVESNITQDPVRRLAGVSPSYSDGVLICPTGAGCVVAVDLATRSLLWGYIYSHPGEQPGGRRMRGMIRSRTPSTIPTVPCPAGWTAPPRLSTAGCCSRRPRPIALYCLNLADGKPAWASAKPRGEHYYIACVHKGVVVLVGRNSIDAVNLEDGSKAWGGRTIALPSGAGVCGHGCYAGGQYFVPLSSGEVMAIDLEAGKVVGDRQVPSAAGRGARQPGLLSRPGDFAGAGRFGTLLPGRCRAGRSGAPPGRQSRRRRGAHAPRRNVSGRRQVDRGRCRFPPGL